MQRAVQLLKSHIMVTISLVYETLNRSHFDLAIPVTFSPWVCPSPSLFKLCAQTRMFWVKILDFLFVFISGNG